ncbi:MAG: hypothetical protein GY719_00685 [bacterium]|nr:hypothetical protein [bacterium]
MSRFHLRSTIFAALLLTLALLPGHVTAQLGPPPEPAGNPLTTAKANLGKALFWDEQTSSTRTVACGTCHIPATGGDDPRSLTDPLALHPGPDGLFGGADDVVASPGVPLTDATGKYLSSPTFGLTEQATGRRTISSINAGYSSSLFWDGRAEDEFVDPVTMAVILPSGGALESQAVGPLVSDVEMGHAGIVFTDVLARIAVSKPLAVALDAPAELLDWLRGRSYAELFEEAFGTPEITAARVGMAIASYERTQFTNQTPFDEFILGGDVLTPQELAGRGVFVANSCDRCHELEIMSDHDFHYTGVRPPDDDIGRMEVTGLEDDKGKMRTPSLRNLELRAPYMHNGRFDTIEDVVEFYNRGGDFDARNKDPFVRPLMLTQQEKDDLAAFLKRPLTDPRLAGEEPPFHRPTLYTESGRVPVIEGAGLPGTGAIVPQPVALEPPMVGNPGFTVAVYDALGGADALLVIDDVDPGLTSPISGDFAFESIVLEGAGAGAGFGSVNIAIANDPALAGTEWFGRWYVTDAGGGGTEAVTPVFRFTVFEQIDHGDIFIDGFESGDVGAWTSSSP